MRIDIFSDGRVETRRSFFNKIIFIYNIGMTLYCCTYNAHIGIAKLAHSMIMEVGLNLIFKLSIWLSLPLKIANAFQHQRLQTAC